MGKLYSADRLPGFVPDTEGLLAQPRDLAFACVRAPQYAAIPLVPAFGSAPTHNHPNKGERDILPHSDAEPHVHLREDDLHLLVNLRGVHIVAPDALIEGENATYAVTAKGLPSDDARTAYLHGLWAAYGVRPPVMEVRRTSPLHVVGQIAEQSAFTGARFKGGHRRYYTLEPFSYVVRTHDDTLAVVPQTVMAYLFDHLDTPDGELAYTTCMPLM